MEPNFEDLDDDIIISLGGLAALNYFNKPVRKQRKEWVCDYLKDRSTRGRFVKDFDDLRDDPQRFKENFHMTPSQFDHLFNLLEPHLMPIRNTRPDDCISPKERLSVTLEYLASGDIQRHLALVYRISKQAIGPIIEDTCVKIYDVLKPKYMKPLIRETWTDVSNRFNCKWNFPNCVGCIDGKHIAIDCPDNAGSSFYNYKGFHSIVLMAVSDADYKFLYFDLGAYGSEGDSTIFRECDFGKALLQRKLNLPLPASVHGHPIPYVFLGDDAFPLHKNIMKPFKPPRKGMFLTPEETIFNYRLSRARRCVENCFGILCARWICLARSMFLNPDRAQKVASACCLLHNYLMSEQNDYYCPPGFADSYREDGSLVEGTWRSNIGRDSIFNFNLPSQNIGRPKNEANDIREHLKLYFNSPEGSVPWQNKVV